MNRTIECAFRNVLFSTAALLVATPFAATPQDLASAGTFVVRSGPRATIPSGLSAPADVIAGRPVGEQFCNALQCVVFTSTPGHVAALKTLQSEELVTLEPLPDARKIYFAQALYDADTETFEADFPGRTETTPLLSNALFAVVFKAWPERAWIDALEKAGLQPVSPIQSMAWLVYGPRSAIIQLPKQFSTIYKTIDLPAGLKRFNLDTREEGDDDGPQWAYVHVVAGAAETIAGLLRSRGGSEPSIIDQTPSVVSYTSVLTRQEAIDFASFPEVLSVRRMSLHVGPADERSNRIVGGTFATPDTTYNQSSLGTYPPNYWNNYLTSLSAIGIHPENQVIGLLDTGVDAGLQEGGTGTCPHFLRVGPSCRLVFAADTTSGNAQANTRGDDYWFHGTLVASILAGDAGPDSPGRDTESYAFTQGVAAPNQGTTQGARLALAKFWTADCRGDTYRNLFGGDLSNSYTRLQYSLVELSASTNLPDYNVTGPGVTLFNHSWARDDPFSSGYEETAVILDRSTRRLNRYYWDFDSQTRLYGASGQPTPALHVVAAGNDYPACSSPPPGLVLTPGTARNVITVGASESYNQQTYGLGTCLCMADTDANDQRQVALFSRTGWIFNRAKPDLVAPGTRSYGGSTSAAGSCHHYACNENLTNAGPGQPHYQWSSGTSFAAPVVTGAATLVREWFVNTLHLAAPSPALTKATLLTATKNLAPCMPGCPDCGCYNCPLTCDYCGTMRARPDIHQGWGGLALNELFRPATNYFFRDQQQLPTFTSNGAQWNQTLAVVDHTRPVEITVVWTDAVTIANNPSPEATLVNDLDLRVDIPGPGQATWAGNHYYTCSTCCDRKGFTVPQSGTIIFDHKNNVERISLPNNAFATDGAIFYLKVTATSLQGDGVNPDGNTPRQDFAIAVSNAH